MQSEQPKYRIGMTVAACVWLGLFPLLQGGTYTRLTYDKWIIMLILTGFTFVSFLVDLILRRRVILNEVKDLLLHSFLPLAFAAALLLWSVLSCLFSSYGPETWWLGAAARYEGLLTHICYFLLFACFFFTRVNLKPVQLSAAGGIILFFIVVFLQRAGGNPLGLYPPGRSYALNPEFQGTIGNIDMGTGYLLLLAGLFLHGLIGATEDLRAGRKSRPVLSFAFPAVLFLAFAMTLFLIFTMDVQFGAVTLAVLFLYTFLRFLPKKWRLPLLVFLVILVLLVVWFWPARSGGIWELHEILHGRGRLSFGSNRVAVWLFSLRLAQENLLLGGGSGTFGSRFNRYLSENNLTIPKEQDGKPLPDYFDNPHNEYIQQLTDHGIPALLLFLALLLFAVFRRRCFRLSSPCSAAVLCYAVQAFFSFSVCLVTPMFWVLLGMSFRE